MKLWQKIFISTLLLVILAVDVTAVLLLTNNHRLMVRREQERAASEYAYLSASLKDYVLYTRLQYNRILLSEEETADAVKTALQNSGKNRKSGISLYYGEQQMATTSLCPQEIEHRLLDQIQGEERVSAILENDSCYYVLTASEIQPSFQLYFGGV